MPDVLIELFSEEIPARMQARARDDLRKLVTDGLVEAGLTYASAGAFSTPRRLALAIEGLTAESRAVREERKGPRADAPAAALEGFLRSTGLTREQLELRDEKKGQVFFAVVEKPGRPAAAILAEVLERVIREFPWPKSMRWGAGSLPLGAAAAFDPLRDERRGRGERGAAGGGRDRRRKRHARPSLHGARAVFCKQFRRLPGEAEARLRGAGCGRARGAYLGGCHAGGLCAGAGGGAGCGASGRGGGAGGMAGGADGVDRRRSSWTCRPRFCRPR